MVHSRLAGILCLLLPLASGCNDPGFDLRRAAYEGKAAAVEKILKAHPEVLNACEKPPPAVTTPAAGPGGPPSWVVELFNSERPDFFMFNRSGFNPLHMALWTEREDIVKLLLSHQADVNATSFYDATPLMIAMRRDKKPVLTTLLLDAKADVNLKSFFGHTPLEWAVNGKNAGAAELLIKRGAQVNTTNATGRTPLHSAASNGSEPLVRLLLLHKAAINAQDARGNTPLSLATVVLSDTVSLLLESGADVNIVNNEGVSPLFRAVQRDLPTAGNPQFTLRHHEVIDLLLARKAQVNVTNIFGKTLFQEALRIGDPHVINRLRQHGAKE